MVLSRPRDNHNGRGHSRYAATMVSNSSPSGPICYHGREYFLVRSLQNSRAAVAL